MRAIRATLIAARKLAQAIHQSFGIVHVRMCMCMCVFVWFVPVRCGSGRLGDVVRNRSRVTIVRARLGRLASAYRASASCCRLRHYDNNHSSART